MTVTKHITGGETQDPYLHEASVLNRLLRILSAVTLTVVVPSVWAATVSGLWSIAVVDVVAYLAVVFVAFSPRATHEAKAATLIVASFAVAVVVLFAAGVAGAGYIWLIATIVFSAVFASVGTIVVSTLAVVVCLAVFAYVTGTQSPQGPDQVTAIVVIALSVLMVGTSSAFVVHQLIYQLRRIALAQQRVVDQLKAQLDENAATQRQLHASLQAKQVLLRELDHRVKNNLQLTLSLINMAASRTHYQYLTDLLTRVQAISEVHHARDNSGDTQFVELNMVVHQVAMNVKHSFDHAGIALRFTPDQYEIQVDMERATNVALACNEIITNAFKHGFPLVALTDPPNGDTPHEITIATRIDRDRNSIEVVVGDNGIGLTADAQLGEGLRLVHGLMEQIGAEVEVCHDGHGTTYRMRIAHRSVDDPSTLTPLAVTPMDAIR